MLFRAVFDRHINGVDGNWSTNYIATVFDGHVRGPIEYFNHHIFIVKMKMTRNNCESRYSQQCVPV